MDHLRRRNALPHLPSLDGLRAFAVLLTSLVHLLPGVLPGGFVGVDVFFVLSGFLITTILLGEQSAEGRIRVSRFYLRRARRLLPAVIALLMVFTAVVLLSSPGRHELLVAAIVDAGVLSYVINWAGVLGHDVPWQTDHLWSLSVEEQFYLLWPLALIALLKVASRRTIMIVTLAGVALSSVGQAVVYQITHQVAWSYEATPFHAGGILLGCLLGQSFSWRSTDLPFGRWALRRWPVGVAVAVLVVLSLTIDLDHAFAFTGGILIASLAAGVIVMGLIVQDTTEARSLVRRVFNSRIMVALGKRSYSIYLWQNFMAWVFTASLRESWLWLPVNVVATLATAEISYRYVERVFFRRKKESVDQATAHHHSSAQGDVAYDRHHGASQ